MEIQGDAAVAGEKLGLATRGRQAIDVAQEVEHEEAPIGGNVDRHPGALVGDEVNLASQPSRGPDVPRFLNGLHGLHGPRRGGIRGHEQNDAGGGVTPSRHFSRILPSRRA